MADLSTTYLDLKLKNPIVASASPLSEKVETVKKLEENGVSSEQIKRVHSPIGLEIHAETPEEIAVSIMAEIIELHQH